MRQPKKPDVRVGDRVFVLKHNTTGVWGKVSVVERGHIVLRFDGFPIPVAYTEQILNQRLTKLSESLREWMLYPPKPDLPFGVQVGSAPEPKNVGRAVVE